MMLPLSREWTRRGRGDASPRDRVAARWHDRHPMDAPRKLLVATLARRPDLDLEKLSRAIGRNHAYLRQYVMRGTPRELPEAMRQAVAARLGLRADDLRPDGPGAGATGPAAPTPPGDQSHDLPHDLPVSSTR